ncbi:MAG: metallophosphoesterase [Chloroflexota bacterium]
MTRSLSRRAFIRNSLITAGATAIGAGVYTLEVEKRWIDFVNMEVTLPRLTPAFDGYRIVHISDLHMDGLGMTPEHFASVANKINALQPDLIVATGDYVTFDVETFAPLAGQSLAALSATDGVITIMGNHDHWTNINTVHRELDTAGLTVLRNEVHTITRGDETLHIAGLDDAYERKDRLNDVLAALPDNDSPAISLVHEPDYADISSRSGRFDLQLSGHTHGGQVRVPGHGAIFLPAMGMKYAMGLYQVRGMLQYTNRGLGTIPPSVRFACRAEVTTFTLRSPAGHDGLRGQ